MRKRYWVLAAAVLGGVWGGGSAEAALVATQFDSTTGFSGPGEIAPSTNDLLTGLIETGSVFASQENLGADTTAASLTNGQFGPPSLTPAPGPNPEVAIIGTFQTLTYTLGNGPNGTGYTASEFRSYSGWQDPGRSRQDYTLLYSTVAAPTTFLPLITVHGTANTLDELTVVKDTLGATIPGVYAIQFQTAGDVQNGYVGWREFDLIGTPTPGVPEPGVVGLAGVGVVCGLWRRRR